MKNTMFRRVVCSALALSLSVSCFVPTAFAETDNSLGTADESSEALTGTDSIRQNSYSKYLKKYEDTARPTIDEIVIKGSDYLPDSVTSIGVGAFALCTGLEEVRLSRNLTVLPGAAFFNCTHLRTIEIPKSISSVGRLSSDLSYPNTSSPFYGVSPYGAFQGCSDLSELSFEESFEKLCNVIAGKAGLKR